MVTLFSAIFMSNFVSNIFSLGFPIIAKIVGSATETSAYFVSTKRWNYLRNRTYIYVYTGARTTTNVSVSE